MKKLILILIVLVVILFSSQSFSFYIWEGFDNPFFPPYGWTLSSSQPNCDWTWSIRCSGYGSGLGSCKANFADYQNGFSLDLITPTFPATVFGDSIIFDHAYTSYSGENDQLIIYYSTNTGTSWGTLILYTGGNSGPLVTAPNTGMPFVPTSSQWATKRYPLPPGTNRLKFTAVSAYGNNLFIDNIKIGTRNTSDVGAVGFSRYIKGILPNTPDTPKVYVRNFGTSSVSFPVTLNITPGSYSSTQNVTNLAAGAIQLVTFPVWTPTTAGNYTFKAHTSLTSDQCLLNDTAINIYTATINPRNVLIEYATGTWCQWCPCAKTAILELENYYPNTVVLAYHGPTSSTDPYRNFNGNNIIGLLSISAYPTGTPDRLINPYYCSASGLFEFPGTRYIQKPASPVKIDITNYSFNPSTKLLNVTLNATALENLTGQYRINYVITEDNLVYTQTGNSYCQGASNYIHKWVVRNMVNSAIGDSLNSGGVWNNNQTITKSFTTTLDNSWVMNNCNLVIFVYKNASPLYSAEIQQSIQQKVLITGTNEPVSNIPLFYELNQNYPNPFNPKTNIKFGVPKYGYVSFKIYDITGKYIATYLNGYIEAGYYNVEIDGSSLASGIYFYTLEANDFKETKKMILIK